MFSAVLRIKVKITVLLCSGPTDRHTVPSSLLIPVVQKCCNSKKSTSANGYTCNGQHITTQESDDDDDVMQARDKNRVTASNSKPSMASVETNV